MPGLQLRPDLVGPLAMRAGWVWASLGHVRDWRQVPELRRAVSVDRVPRVCKDVSA